MPVIKVQVQLFGVIEVNTSERENEYPIDELLTFMDVEEDEADDQDWAEGMVKFDLDNDPSIIMEETTWNYTDTKVAVLEA